MHILNILSRQSSISVLSESATSRANCYLNTMSKNLDMQHPEFDAEIERLRIQANTWQPDAEYIFDHIGVLPGWQVADLGCGPMGVLKPLSIRVGDEGTVLGVDSNPRCLIATQKFILQNRLKNVKLIKGDFYSSELKPGSFDLTHVRFVFSHTGCDLNLLNRMIEITREGGYVVSQESDWSTWNCYPSSKAWDKLRDALIQVFELDGGDINAGKRNYQMFRQTGLEDVQMRSSVLALPLGNPYRNGMSLLARSLHRRMLEAGILKDEEFNELVDETDREMANPDTIVISYLLSQVWGRVGKS
jgi:ubiquinone/menaquinone biosynthesis C-methylase UbiE